MIGRSHIETIVESSKIYLAVSVTPTYRNNVEQKKTIERTVEHDKQFSSPYKNINTDTQYLKTPVQKQCRICLYAEPISTTPLVSPCKCTGSVQYVHMECLKYWIGKKFYNSNLYSKYKYLNCGVPCEICRDPIFITSTTRVYCLTAYAIKNRIDYRTFLFIVVLVFELFDLIALGYLIALFGTKEVLFQLGDVISMLMLIGMLILVLLAVTMIWLGVRAFLLRSNIVVEGIVERGN